jgi:hypothetical protein
MVVNTMNLFRKLAVGGPADEMSIVAAAAILGRA